MFGDVIPAINNKQMKLQYNDHQMTLNLDMNVGFGGDKWPAADQFCHFVTDIRWKQHFFDVFNDCRVIDIGSGTGLTGILIDLAFQPKEVIITDQESHMAHISLNIGLNPATRCVPHVLDWKSPESLGTFDVLLVFEW
jgi:hypothetical protein